MKNRVRELRKEKKITLKGLAERMGVSESYAYILETKKSLAAGHRAKLAQIFGVGVDEVAPLDADAKVISRLRGGGGGRGKAGARGGDIGAAVGNLRAAVDGLSKALGSDQLEVLALMGKMSAGNRGTLLTLARSLGK
jgi:DNA-binding XRE family transcriptional regulator